MMKRFLSACAVVLALVSTVDARPRGVVAVSGASSSNGGSMVMGLGEQSYQYSNTFLLNWAQTAGGARSGGSGAYGLYNNSNCTSSSVSLASAFNAGNLDTNGDLAGSAGLSSAIKCMAIGIFTPSSPANVITDPLNGSNPWWKGLKFHITWTAGGTNVPVLRSSATLGSGSVALDCVTLAPRHCTFTLGLNPGNVAFNFPIDGTNTSTPFTNVWIYEDQYAANVAALATCTIDVDCDHFRPAWKNDIKAFGRLRVMDQVEVNKGSPLDLTQMADFNYRICVACDFGGANASFNASISTTGGVSTLATGSLNTNSSFSLAAGVQVNYVGAPANLLIVSQSSGSAGLAGNYVLNQNVGTVGSTTMYFSPTSSYVGEVSGLKGGAHPSVYTELARVTGADIWYTLPITITDAGAQAVFTYFKNHMPSGQKVFYELCNEIWNSQLGICNGNARAQGLVSTIEPDNTSPVQYGGYRMGQLMKLARDIYGTDAYNLQNNPTGTWAGILGGKMDTAPTLAGSAAGLAITGWLACQAAAPSSGCDSGSKIYQYFESTAAAPYFSDFAHGGCITQVTPGATTTFTMGACSARAAGIMPFSNGNTVWLRFSDTSAGTVGSVLDNQLVVVSGASGSTFQTTTISTATKTYSNAGNSSDIAVVTGTNVTGLANTMNASTACFAASTATAPNGTTSGSTFTEGSGVTGTFVNGMHLSGSGMAANTTIISPASAGVWNLNNTVGTLSTSITGTPCATAAEYFAMETSKAMITGSSDLGWTPNITQTGFLNIFQNMKLLANTYGLTFLQYEGVNQFIMVDSGGGTSPLCCSTSYGNINGIYTGWIWDAAGNDPLYTPTKVVRNQFDMMRNSPQFLGFSAKYVEQVNSSVFSTWRYMGDTNPFATAILAENATPAPTDTTPAAAWTFTYNSSTDHAFASGSGTTQTCPYTAPVGGGTAIIATTTTSTATATITIDGGSVINPTASTVNSWSEQIFTQAVSAGAHTVAITWSGSTAFRSCYAMTLAGRSGSSAISAVTGNPQKSASLNVLKGSFILAVAALPGSAAPTFDTSSSQSGTVTGNVVQINNSAAQASGFAYWSPGPPFSSAIFNVSTASANGMAAISISP